ncbi:MAG: FAD-dependent monooxygenase [Chloroflexi bacterium]|nr:FAD-dependent monooxygenase [Chloroflexota bacterium]
MNLDADVIVAGAGPGGASAAYFLGERGCKVLVLEKAHLPRYKPCGGGVPTTIFDFFPFDFEPVIEQRISHGQGGDYHQKGRNVAGQISDCG